MAPLVELILILRGHSFHIKWQIEALMAIMDLGLVQGNASAVRVRAVWPDLILRKTALRFTHHRLHLATELRDSLNRSMLRVHIERGHATSQRLALFDCTEDYVLDPATLYYLVVDKLLKLKHGVLQSLNVFQKLLVLC